MPLGIISKSGFDLVMVFNHVRVIIFFKHHYSREVVLFILCFYFLLGFQFHFYWILKVCYFFTWFNVSIILKILEVYLFFLNLMFVLVKLYDRNSLLLLIHNLLIIFIKQFRVLLYLVELLILLIELLVYMYLRYAF